MTKEDIYSAWAPENSLWAPWAKAVLFAHLEAASMTEPVAAANSPNVSWAPNPAEKFALVLDLPGDEGVWAGIALAIRGYRPVPLYNAVPLPVAATVLDPSLPQSIAAVNVLPIISALRRGADHLPKNIAGNAPPVFLLDANRHGDPQKLQPGHFDNRSICFTTDFPSANFLHAHGIERILLVQRNRTDPFPDLAHVLRRWQVGGLSLERIQIDSPQPREKFQVSRPSWYGAMFQRAFAAFGLRRAPAGGFGAWMPDSAAVG